MLDYDPTLEDEDVNAYLAQNALVDAPTKVPGIDDSSIQEARRQRDEDIAAATLAQGLTQIGAGIAGTKADTSAFDAYRKAAQTKAAEATLDEKTKAKMVADFIKGKKQEKKDADNLAFREKQLETTSELAKSNQDLRDQIAKATLDEKAQARIAREEERKAGKELKAEERRRLLETPYGEARTADDAKQLKQAAELKDSFDRTLDEMIDLRKEYGAEAFNRTAVERGKQLSKDLLLKYKDMAKLGVLSVSDENILNAIIPPDPLGYSVSQLKGEDPIMNRLEKFKGDVGADFQSKLKNRIYKGAPAAPGQGAGKYQPGSIVKVKGISYVVGADGDSLEKMQ